MSIELGMNFLYILHPAVIANILDKCTDRTQKNQDQTSSGYSVIITSSSKKVKKNDIMQIKNQFSKEKDTNNFSRGFATDNLRKSFTVMLADGNFSVNQDSELYFSLIYDLKMDNPRLFSE